MLNYRSADTLFRRASGTVACVSVLALTAIVLFLLAQGLPIFKDVPIGDFLFTTDIFTRPQKKATEDYITGRFG